ncbi:hypothetical protein Cfor_03357 [Coptotermes formosanus]|uniref:C-type lectin domain-containing protein n=1 Tax=Coptotermes formosanus TaxID=36987 RepID=A0A6L2Q4W8_COPFO|nr:hypothetical protein Cfor_03357 [Coptotermes formosanus]
MSQSWTSTPPPGPGPDYDLFCGLGYYKLQTTPLTWEEARRACAFEGGHLAIINSETEAQVLQMIFARNPKIIGSNQNDYAFLGSHDMFSEGHFTTIFGWRESIMTNHIPGSWQLSVGSNYSEDFGLAKYSEGSRYCY